MPSTATSRRRRRVNHLIVIVAVPDLAPWLCWPPGPWVCTPEHARFDDRAPRWRRRHSTVSARQRWLHAQDQYAGSDRQPAHDLRRDDHSVHASVARPRAKMPAVWVTRPSAEPEALTDVRSRSDHVRRHERLAVARREGVRRPEDHRDERPDDIAPTVSSGPTSATRGSVGAVGPPTTGGADGDAVGTGVDDGPTVGLGWTDPRSTCTGSSPLERVVGW